MMTKQDIDYLTCEIGDFIDENVNKNFDHVFSDMSRLRKRLKELDKKLQKLELLKM